MLPIARIVWTNSILSFNRMSPAIKSDLAQERAVTALKKLGLILRVFHQYLYHMPSFTLELPRIYSSSLSLMWPVNITLICRTCLYYEADVLGASFGLFVCQPLKISKNVYCSLPPIWILAPQLSICAGCRNRGLQRQLRKCLYHLEFGQKIKM